LLQYGSAVLQIKMLIKDCSSAYSLLIFDTKAMLSQWKPRDAAVKFDTYRNLQRHSAVLSAIARLSCLFLSRISRTFKKKLLQRFLHLLDLLSLWRNLLMGR